jgi:hypothetical protein
LSGNGLGSFFDDGRASCHATASLGRFALPPAACQVLDDAIIERWVENYCYQHFTGETPRVLRACFNLADSGPFIRNPSLHKRAVFGAWKAIRQGMIALDMSMRGCCGTRGWRYVPSKVGGMNSASANWRRAMLCWNLGCQSDCIL